jgi:hypothetical protein
MSKRRPKEKIPPLPKGITISTNEELEEMEADPRFQEMMRRADEDEREGRWTSIEDVIKGMAEARGRPR